MDWDTQAQRILESWRLTHQISQVASQETPLRHEGHFEYNMSAARSLARHGAVAPSAHYDAADLAAGEALTYSRGASSSLYGPYNSSSSSRYYPSTWHGSSSAYGADGTADDYGMYYAQDSGTSQVMPYSWSSSRGAGGRTPSSSLYVDTADSSSYAYGNHSSTLVHRPAPAAGDSHGFSLHGFAAALPSGGGSSSSSNGTDRLLPTPINRSLPSSTSSSSYRDHAGYGSSSRSSGASSSSVTSPTSPLSEAYGTAGIDSASLGSYATAASRSYSDSYGTSGSTAAEGSIFTAEERGLGSQGSQLDMTGYTYGDTSSTRRASAGVSTSSSGGQLPNGATYEPTHHHSQSHHSYETAAGSGGGGGGLHGGGHRASVGSRR